MWKARLLTLCAGLAAALVAPQQAAAQEAQEAQEPRGDLVELYDAPTTLPRTIPAVCKIIPIIAVFEDSTIIVPPSVTASLSGDGCVCWKGVPPSTDWDVDFKPSWGTPFIGPGDPFHFDPEDECGELERKGAFKYDVTVTGIPDPLDPWLDVVD